MFFKKFTPIFNLCLLTLFFTALHLCLYSQIDELSTDHNENINPDYPIILKSSDAIGGFLKKELSLEAGNTLIVKLQTLVSSVSLAEINVELINDRSIVESKSHYVYDQKR